MKRSKSNGKRKRIAGQNRQRAIFNVERASAELKQFVYVASHDLQEPLRKIITLSDLLKNNSGELSNAAKERVEKIMDSAIRMKQLVEDLLNYSNTDGAKNKFRRTNLNTILKDVLIDFDDALTDAHAQVNRNHLPEISAVPVQMKQLFQNLISNSVKFRKNKVPPQIDIESRMLSSKEMSNYHELNKNTRYTAITIKDNGIGFNKKFADQVFVIFQRLHNKEQYGGTGIGLALCKKIVHNHGGEIFVESEEDIGTTFRIILPVNHQNPGAE